jgi:NAD(P)-dependent dehydrogenase (short-subunit alcohol dehydrogenase family)
VIGTALLDGRVALITGAGGSIGGATLRAFEQAGARCLGVDTRADGAIVACDVTDPDAVEAAFAAAERLGRLTDVVHAAGVVSVGRLADLTLQELRRVLDVNLVGSFLVAQAAVRRLGRGGALTLIASQAGLRGGALWSAYSASKGGVVRLAESLAEELGPDGVRVNAVCPGIVQTPMIDTAIADLAGLTGERGEAIHARYERGIPLGRFADPAEVRLPVLAAGQLRLRLLAGGGRRGAVGLRPCWSRRSTASTSWRCACPTTGAACWASACR